MPPVDGLANVLARPPIALLPAVRIEAAEAFISSVTFAGVVRNGHIMPPVGSMTAQATPATPVTPAPTPAPNALLSLPIGDQPAPGTSRTVSLSSGGSLTVSATLDLFKLNPKDRAFVFDLIDKLAAYEEAGKAGAPP